MQIKKFGRFFSTFVVLAVVFNSVPLHAASTSDEESVESESVITVTAKPYASKALTAPQSVAVVEGRKLDQVRGQTAGDAIKDTPGVDVLTTGPGIVKPVIRGLTSQRVVVVLDGVRNEVQQWGDEHSPEIDPMTIGRVEVLRGPNSLLYGSDALGGVVAFSSLDLPDASKGAPKLGGLIDLDGFSNNSQFAGGLSLYGAGGPFGYRINYSGRHAGDYKQGGGDTAWNSAFKDENGSGVIGLHQDWGQIDAGFNTTGKRIELTDDDPAATPYQSLRNEQGKLHASINAGSSKIEATVGVQQDRRKEFDDKDAVDPSLHLLTKTSNVDLKLHHPQLGPVKGTIGVTGSHQNTETLGLEALIPSNRINNFGGYIYEELPVSKFTFNAGIRGDTEKMDVDENADIPVAAQTRKYNQTTGAVGAVWHVLEPLAFAVNVGKGYRAPVPFELFANGVHEGTGRFEIGNPDLKPEKSTNLDFATRYSSKRVKGEIAVYQNKIKDFIFAEPDPTGAIDPGSGFPIFNNTQANATLTGGELALEGSLTDWLSLTGGYNIVRGKNDKTGDPLPFIPADNFKGGVRLQRKSLMNAIDNPYFGVDARAYLQQNRVAPNELAVQNTDHTPGYTLWDVKAGSEIKVGSNHLNVDIGCENLTDKKYHDHLSRNFRVAGVMNQGRNYFVKMSMPFGIVK